jgi:hypothetical protein
LQKKRVQLSSNEIVLPNEFQTGEVVPAEISGSNQGFLLKSGFFS